MHKGALEQRTCSDVEKCRNHYHCQSVGQDCKGQGVSSYLLASLTITTEEDAGRKFSHVHLGKAAASAQECLKDVVLEIH